VPPRSCNHPASPWPKYRDRREWRWASGNKERLNSGHAGGHNLLHQWRLPTERSNRSTLGPLARPSPRAREAPVAAL
jgi:hypothetical protein